MKNDIEEKKYSDYTLMDDLFFSAAVDGKKEIIYRILSVILNKEDLVIKKVVTQKKLTSINNHSLILDIFALDSNNNIYNIEIQNAYDKNIIYRVRYHKSLLEVSNQNKGDNYSSSVKTYVIFFCNFDLFKENKPLYEVKKHIKINNKYIDYDDGEYIIYVNCLYKENSSKIGKLIQDITSKISDRKWYNELIINEGDINMGEQKQRIYDEGIKFGEKKGREEGREEGKVETTQNIISSILDCGYNVDEVSKMTKISREEIEKIQNKINLK